MHNLVLIALFIALVVTTRYFQHLARKLGPQKYTQHMIFEGLLSINQKYNAPFYKSITFIDLFWVSIMAFYILQKNLFPEYVWQFIAGFAAMLYAFILGSSVASTLVYKYALKYPDQISGETQFKAGLVGVIQKSIVIQILTPSIVLAFMLPSPLIYGVLAALGTVLIFIFRKLSIY